MSFKRYLIEYGFFKNRYAYMHNFRKYLHESKNNPKEDLVIPEEKIVKDFCSQQDTVITVTQLLLKHFNKYIETLDNIKTNKDNTINEPKILQKVTLQHTLPHPPMSFSSDTEDRAS